MALTKITAENFTVFENITIPFTNGLNRYSDISEVGMNLQKISDMKKIKLKFILVVKNAEDITWLAGSLAELKARLLPMRKIWGIELAVLNEELAGTYGLTC